MSATTEGNEAVVVDLSRVLVANNNLFTRNQYHTHDVDGFANEVFILVNGGTGTRVVRLLGSVGCDRTIPCLTSSDTPFTFIAGEDIHQLLNGDDMETRTASPHNNNVQQLNSCIVGATCKREDAVVVVVISSSSGEDDDEVLFQPLVQESSNNMASFHGAFPLAAYVVLGANIPDTQRNETSLLPLLPPHSPPPSWSVVVAPTRLVTSIYDDASSPSAAPCRLILSKVCNNNNIGRGGKWIDCTHIVDSTSPFFPGGQMPLRCPAKRCTVEHSNNHNPAVTTAAPTLPPPHKCSPHQPSIKPVREVIITGCDVGTHMDSPRHFYSNLASISHIPPSRMMGIPVIVVDVSEKCRRHELQASSTTPLVDYTITVADLESVEKELLATGTTSLSPPWEGALVLAHTGWWKLFIEAQNTKNADLYKRGGTLAKEHQITTTDMWFPGFSKEAAEWLLARNVNGIGIDTLSLDCGSSEEFPVHQIMLGAGKYQIENVNFSEMEFGEKDAAKDEEGICRHRTGVAIAAPMLVEGAFESQTRLLLQIDNNN